MTIYDKVLAYLREHGFSRQLTYENFTILPPDRRRGLFVHVMPGQCHFCVCQLPQVVQSGGNDIGSESFAFLSVREGNIDSLELQHEAGLRALGAELVEYEATLAVQPVSDEEKDEETIGPEDFEGEAAEEDTENEDSESSFDYAEWLHHLAAIDDGWPARIPDSEKLPYVRTWQQLKLHTHYSDELVDAVSVHIARCIPEGFTAHGRVWSVAAMKPVEKGQKDLALLAVYVNGFPCLELTAPESGAGQPPFHAQLIVLDGKIDSVDLAALRQIPGLRFIESTGEAEELGFTCISVPSLQSLARAMTVPGVIFAARHAVLRMLDEKPSRKRPQPPSNLAVLDHIASGARPEALSVNYSENHKDYLLPGCADAAWLHDSQYAEYLASLTDEVLSEGTGGASRLVDAANRAQYRAPSWRRVAALVCMLRLKIHAENDVSVHEIAYQLTRSNMPELVAQTVMLCCNLAPAVEGQPFATPLSFLSKLNGHLELLSLQHELDVDMDISRNLEGAIFAGVLFTGDAQVMPLLESAWSRLSRQAKIAAFELRPYSVSYAYLEFVLARLGEIADSDDALCGEMIRHLKALPECQTLPSIEDRLFIFNEPESENLFAEDSGEDAREDICYADYLRENREVFDDIAQAENKPRLMPDLIKEWKLFNNSDLERRKAEAEGES